MVGISLSCRSTDIDDLYYVRTKMILATLYFIDINADVKPVKNPRRVISILTGEDALT